MGFRGGVKSVPSMQLRQDTEQGPAHPQQEKTGGVMGVVGGENGQNPPMAIAPHTCLSLTFVLFTL